EKTATESMETDSVAHLKTDYKFKMGEEYALKSLIKSLHPTPAVAGLPIAPSLACILQYEGYDRQYYCGIIGETSPDNTAHLYVNLRCMQIGEKEIAIYVGGGITAASDPEEEWRETIIKGKTMEDCIHSTKV